ncbi:restriction endonuclease subunit S [Vibrio sp. 99-70-13A1]|uniref:restriction endonuclease subunit S n=1 Tax=Vibrio sp. 99-70-13A1 TaxID=2607601 RepID=UPI0014933A79|nr:restriction endonuclease subunit S [Vibrio sp. 99-70-13A1]NOH99063.1 restriction endonuclease subunit S [Vibrio sp. 99-70-13A1]
MSVEQTSMNQLITDNIDIWTSTVKTKSASGRGSSKKRELYGVKKLRELILELAVRGKLVPQDSTDEPASVLLGNIKEEQARLVKEKKIKKPKPLPPLSSSDKPFTLPLGWEWELFGNVCHIERGGSPRPIKSFITDSSDGLNWIKIGDTDIGGKYITSTAEKIRPEGLSKTRQVYPGDFLLTNSMSFGRPYITKIEGCIHDGWLRLSPPSSLDKDYLYSLLSSPFIVRSFKKSAAGAVVMNLNADKVRETIVAIPPTSEQHRIVAKVDELMTLCDQLEQQTEASITAHQVLVTTLLDTLTNSANAEELMQNWARISEHFDTLFTAEASIDQLKQTILQLAVMGKLVPQDPNDEPAAKLLERIAEEKAQLIKEKKIKKQKVLPPIADDEKLFELPNGWEWARVGTFGVLGTGATPSRSNPKYWDSPDHNWVSSGETANLFVGQTKEKVSELAIKETNVSVYPVGTLIVAMYGQGKTRGQITELSEPAGTNQACAAISLIEPNTAHKDFVKLYFRKSYEELRSNAAGGAQPNLNVGKVQNTVIAVPPLEEQHRINVMVHSLLELCDSLKCNLTKAQTTQLHLTDAIVEQCARL